MTDSVVLVSIFDGIATIVLNRPAKHNAMDNYVVEALLQGLENVAQDPSVRVILLKANGENFCAGGDIAWMQQMAASSLETNQQDAERLALLMYTVYTCAKPIIVLAQGMTLGGGLGLLAASDIVIATNHASFAFSEVKLAIAPSVISPYVISAIGERWARYYFLTAARFGASEAHHLGLIHHIVEPEALASAGLAMAHQLSQSSSHALTETKKLIHAVASETISSELSHKTAQHLATMRMSMDAKEGLQAFLEKRTAKWN